MRDSPLIAVGMSGGVDSSVAAYLLKQQGHRVVGLFMKNWDERDASGACPAERDFADVAAVCDRIGIPVHSVELIEEYREQVFQDLLDGYRAGETPNPDILCNREIKFDAFLRRAREIGAEWLATGHYCRTKQGRLLKGVDPLKDQSYFLSGVRPGSLDRVLFPVGDLPKARVREIAREAGLPTHSKKESMGICFIGKRDFRQFLQGYLAAQPGEFRHLDGRVAGRHVGAIYYTLGQRKGLGLGGEGECWYVVGKDVGRNIVYVERGAFHPALYADELTAVNLNWLAEPPTGRFRCKAKVRYRQPDQDCAVHPLEGGRVRVVFDLPQRAVTPRQSVVFYQGDLCLGGGRIEAAGPSYHEQGKRLPEMVHSPADAHPGDLSLLP